MTQQATDGQLPTAVLGRTGIQVTRLGFGTALYRAAERQRWASASAGKVLHGVLDAGIDFIDTAYDYVDSERFIGEHLSERYSEFHLATKCGCTDTRPELNSSEHEWTRDNLMRNVEMSLQRLGRDSVDVMQLHNATVAECEQGKLVDALEEMRRAGQVKWIGASTVLPHLPVLLDWGVFDVMQIPYSALEREHENWISRAAEAGVGIIVRGGVAQGEPGSGHGAAERWQQFAAAGLDELREPDESRTAFLLRYTLTHPHVHTTIVGTANLEHLRANRATALRGPLSADRYAEAKTRLDRAGVLAAPA